MANFDNAVTIHPYFKIQEGQVEACKSFLAKFNERTANEEKCYFYNFTLKGDELFCREAYHDAEGVQAHLENVGPVLAEFGKIADLTRIELHGPAEELEKLKTTFADMNPEYYICECGIGR